MDREIKNRYTAAVLDQARERYDIDPADIRSLDAFESFMFEFQRAGRPYILRLGHSRRRSPDLIRGEVDWINYLAAHGAGVAQAVLSAGGELVEPIGDGQGGHFLATAFVKAPGGTIGERGGWSEGVIAAYGRLIGRMHALAKDYRLADPAWKRPDWDDPINMDMGRWLPDDQVVIRDRFRALIDDLQSLPRERDSYGLIHQDAHAGNFFVDDDGRITLFDFDDCAYGHFAYDLAMVLFYALTNRSDAAEFAPHFWRHFMRGYRQENQLDPAWLRHIPHFMKLREIDLYMVIHRSFDPDNIGDGWAAAFMEGRRTRIEQDLPTLDSDKWEWLAE